MPACERCACEQTRRIRCAICKRLVCWECIDSPGWGLGRDTMKWCFVRRDRPNDCKAAADALEDADAAMFANSE